MAGVAVAGDVFTYNNFEDSEKYEGSIKKPKIVERGRERRQYVRELLRTHQGFPKRCNRNQVVNGEVLFALDFFHGLLESCSDDRMWWGEDIVDDPKSFFAFGSSGAVAHTQSTTHVLNELCTHGRGYSKNGPYTIDSVTGHTQGMQGVMDVQGVHPMQIQYPPHTTYLQHPHGNPPFAPQLTSRTTHHAQSLSISTQYPMPDHHLHPFQSYSPNIHQQAHTHPLDSRAAPTDSSPNDVSPLPLSVYFHTRTTLTPPSEGSSSSSAASPGRFWRGVWTGPFLRQVMPCVEDVVDAKNMSKDCADAQLTEEAQFMSGFSPSLRGRSRLFQDLLEGAKTTRIFAHAPPEESNSRLVLGAALNGGKRDGGSVRTLKACSRTMNLFGELETANENGGNDDVWDGFHRCVLRQDKANELLQPSSLVRGLNELGLSFLASSASADGLVAELLTNCNAYGFVDIFMQDEAGLHALLKAASLYNEGGSGIEGLTGLPKEAPRMELGGLSRSIYGVFSNSKGGENRSQNPAGMKVLSLTFRHHAAFKSIIREAMIHRYYGLALKTPTLKSIDFRGSSKPPIEASRWCTLLLYLPTAPTQPNLELERTLASAVYEKPLEKKGSCDSSNLSREKKTAAHPPQNPAIEEKPRDFGPKSPQLIHINYEALLVDPADVIPYSVSESPEAGGVRGLYNRSAGATKSADFMKEQSQHIHDDAGSIRASCESSISLLCCFAAFQVISRSIWRAVSSGGSRAQKASPIANNCGDLCLSDLRLVSTVAAFQHNLLDLGRSCGVGNPSIAGALGVIFNYQYPGGVDLRKLLKSLIEDFTVSSGRLRKGFIYPSNSDKSNDEEEDQKSSFAHLLLFWEAESSNLPSQPLKSLNSSSSHSEDSSKLFNEGDTLKLFLHIKIGPDTSSSFPMALPNPIGKNRASQTLLESNTESPSPTLKPVASPVFGSPPAKIKAFDLYSNLPIFSSDFKALLKILLPSTKPTHAIPTAHTLRTQAKMMKTSTMRVGRPSSLPPGIVNREISLPYYTVSGVVADSPYLSYTEEGRAKEADAPITYTQANGITLTHTPIENSINPSTHTQKPAPDWKNTSTGSSILESTRFQSPALASELAGVPPSRGFSSSGSSPNINDALDSSLSSHSRVDSSMMLLKDQMRGRDAEDVEDGIILLKASGAPSSDPFFSIPEAASTASKKLIDSCSSSLPTPLTSEDLQLFEDDLISHARHLAFMKSRRGKEVFTLRTASSKKDEEGFANSGVQHTKNEPLKACQSEAGSITTEVSEVAASFPADSSYVIQPKVAKGRQYTRTDGSSAKQHSCALPQASATHISTHSTTRMTPQGRASRAEGQRLGGRAPPNLSANPPSHPSVTPPQHPPKHLKDSIPLPNSSIRQPSDKPTHDPGSNLLSFPIAPTRGNSLAHTAAEGVRQGSSVIRNSSLMVESSHKREEVADMPLELPPRLYGRTGTSKPNGSTRSNSVQARASSHSAPILHALLPRGLWNRQSASPSRRSVENFEHPPAYQNRGLGSGFYSQTYKKEASAKSTMQSPSQSLDPQLTRASIRSMSNIPAASHHPKRSSTRPSISTQSSQQARSSSTLPHAIIGVPPFLGGGSGAEAFTPRVSASNKSLGVANHQKHRQSLTSASSVRLPVDENREDQKTSQQHTHYSFFGHSLSKIKLWPSKLFSKGSSSSKARGRAGNSSSQPEDGDGEGGDSMLFENGERPGSTSILPKGGEREWDARRLFEGGDRNGSSSGSPRNGERADEFEGRTRTPGEARLSKYDHLRSSTHSSEEERYTPGTTSSKKASQNMGMSVHLGKEEGAKQEKMPEIGPQSGQFEQWRMKTKNGKRQAQESLRHESLNVEAAAQVTERVWLAGEKEEYDAFSCVYSQQAVKGVKNSSRNASSSRLVDVHRIENSKDEGMAETQAPPHTGGANLLPRHQHTKPPLIQPSYDASSGKNGMQYDGRKPLSSTRYRSSSVDRGSCVSLNSFRVLSDEEGGTARAAMSSNSSLIAKESFSEAHSLADIPSHRDVGVAAKSNDYVLKEHLDICSAHTPSLSRTSSISRAGETSKPRAKLKSAYAMGKESLEASSTHAQPSSKNPNTSHAEEATGASAKVTSLPPKRRASDSQPMLHDSENSSVFKLQPGVRYRRHLESMIADSVRKKEDDCDLPNESVKAMGLLQGGEEPSYDPPSKRSRFTLEEAALHHVVEGENFFSELYDFVVAWISDAQGFFE